MDKKLGLRLLSYAQCMSQQNLIPKKERKELAKLIVIAMNTGDYSDVQLFFQQLPSSQYRALALQDMRKTESCR